MNQKENGNSMDGQAANFSEDFEREALKDSVYLLEEQQRILQEINEEENNGGDKSGNEKRTIKFNI